MAWLTPTTTQWMVAVSSSGEVSFCVPSSIPQQKFTLPRSLFRPSQPLLQRPGVSRVRPLVPVSESTNVGLMVVSSANDVDSVIAAWVSVEELLFLDHFNSPSFLRPFSWCFRADHNPPKANHFQSSKYPGQPRFLFRAGEEQFGVPGI